VSYLFPDNLSHGLRAPGSPRLRATLGVSASRAPSPGHSVPRFGVFVIPSRLCKEPVKDFLHVGHKLGMLFCGGVGPLCACLTEGHGEKCRRQAFQLATCSLTNCSISGSCPPAWTEAARMAAVQALRLRRAEWSRTFVTVTATPHPRSAAATCSAMRRVGPSLVAYKMQMDG